MPRYSQVLFDLDGTLIDLRPAILASYRDAFASTGHQPVTRSTRVSSARRCRPCACSPGPPHRVMHAAAGLRRT